MTRSEKKEAKAEKEEEIMNENVQGETQEAEVNGDEPNDAAVKALAETLKKLDELNEKHLRLAAEYDNYKRRTKEEKALLYNDSVASVVLELLPVMDNFDRAMGLERSEENEQLKAFADGMEMILKQMRDGFEKLGIKEIKAVGEKFDPNLHDAVMHIEDENFGENTVIDELVKGYTINDKVIRASMVRVAN